MRSEATESSTQLQVFLTRRIIAIAWAAVFAMAADSLTLGVGVLLVLYPLIDAVASVLDARSQHGSARQLLVANAAFSGVAAVALGVAASGSKANVLVVFGVWAFVAGGAQLVVALRRRAQGATGGVEFVIQARLLARRRRRLASPAGPVPSAS